MNDLDWFLSGGTIVVHHIVGLDTNFANPYIKKRHQIVQISSAEPFLNLSQGKPPGQRLIIFSWHIYLHIDLNSLTSLLPFPLGGWQGGRWPAGRCQWCGACARQSEGFWEVAEAAVFSESVDEVLLGQMDHCQHAAAGQR